MADVHNDPATFQEFREALGTRDPKTSATYLTTVRDFVTWLALQPGGTPFHVGLMTETAVREYMDFLASTNRAPRTRSKALSALRRFCQWAVDEGQLRRNPARAMEHPTVVAVAPTELSDKQRFVLKTMVEQHASPRFSAGFDLVSVANNHSGDYGKVAFLDEWLTLPTRGLVPIGGGRNKQQAHTPIFQTVQGTTIA